MKWEVRLSGLPGCEKFDKFSDAVEELCRAERDGHVIFAGQPYAGKSGGRLIYSNDAGRAGRYLAVGSNDYAGNDEYIGQYDCVACAFREASEGHHEDWKVVDLRYGTAIAGYNSYYHGGGKSWGVDCIDDDNPLGCVNCDLCSD